MLPPYHQLSGHGNVEHFETRYLHFTCGHVTLHVPQAKVEKCPAGCNGQRKNYLLRKRVCPVCHDELYYNLQPPPHQVEHSRVFGHKPKPVKVTGYVERR